MRKDDNVYLASYTMETVGTFDHLLPQNEFPNFSDNPQNLIPCCNTCLLPSKCRVVFRW